jgi:hypothetical protein
MLGANNAKAATYVRMEVAVLGQIFGAGKVVKVLRVHFVLEVRHERRRLIGRKKGDSNQWPKPIGSCSVETALRERPCQ